MTTTATLRDRLREVLAHQSDVLGSALLSTRAHWRGTMLLYPVAQPKKLPLLYDIEASADCRAVREVLTALGLDVCVYPCPLGGTRYRPKAETLAGEGGLPVLVDGNSGTTLAGAPDIVRYLFREYAGRAPPPAYRPRTRLRRQDNVDAVLRGGRGLDARAARRPRRRLELWSFESSPYSRLVRERLCELEIGYILHNVGKEQVSDLGPAALRLRPGPYKPVPGGRRAELLARWGKVQLPYLEDPNTGAAMFESDKILAYLEQQYAR